MDRLRRSHSTASNSAGGIPQGRENSARDTVVFNVGGCRFEVLKQVIKSRGSTLLGNLLDDISTDDSQPIFVDANPDRFTHIIDWYRFGEMHVPSHCPIEALLQDARYFMLPDVLKINGEVRTLRRSAVTDVHDDLRKAVLLRWPSFEAYVHSLSAQTKACVESLAAKSDEVDTDVLDGIMATDLRSESTGGDGTRPTDKRQLSIYKDFVLAEVSKIDETDPNALEVQSMAPMFMFSEAPAARWRHRWRWADEVNVCNDLRLRILKAELERMGFNCHVEHRIKHGIARLMLRLEVPLRWSL
mmetsp:Transcript_49672/g.118313  ORF Transcript_49672/g.118313 Transcript_49672/m.118313 type:complete len:301 (+) Transcript_49672:116-1018(+)